MFSSDPAQHLECSPPGQEAQVQQLSDLDKPVDWDS